MVAIRLAAVMQYTVSLKILIGLLSFKEELIYCLDI